jgi:hypothetical protein
MSFCNITQDSGQNHHRRGCETFCGEPQGWTLRRTTGISNCRGVALDCATLRTGQDRDAGVYVSVGHFS